jgi:hypothetical protein
MAVDLDKVSQTAAGKRRLLGNFAAEVVSVAWHRTSHALLRRLLVED